jgi:hypothetical protein
MLAKALIPVFAILCLFLFVGSAMALLAGVRPLLLGFFLWLIVGSVMLFVVSQGWISVQLV